MNTLEHLLFIEKEIVRHGLAAQETSFKAYHKTKESEIDKNLEKGIYNQAVHATLRDVWYLIKPVITKLQNGEV